MSSYIPRSLLDQAKPEQSDPSYRMSMLPFGTYPNAGGSGEHLGFAVPGMIHEPMNALMRLIGTPSKPGTFTQGPGYGSNADDMRTLLETFLGGNATRGMGAVERGSAEAAIPNSHGSVISGAEKGSGKYYSLLRDEPDLTVPSQAPFAGNEGINRLAYDIIDRNGDDAGRAELAIDPSKGQAYIDNITLGGNQHGTAGMRDLINSLRALHPEIRSVYGDRTSGARAGSANPRQSIDLFSDQLPSLPGAVVAGAERNTMSDPTGFADAARRAQEMFPSNPIYNRVYRGVSPREKGHVGDLAEGQSRLFASTSPDVASTYAPDWLDNGAVFPLDMSFKNPMTVDAGGNIWDQIPFEGKRWSSTDDLADIATQRGHDGLVVRNVVDNNMMGQAAIPGDTYVALKRGTVTSPLTGETLFSNGLPSLWGSAVAGQQNPQYTNSLFPY